MITKTIDYTIPEFMLPYILNGDISSYLDYEIDQWCSFEQRELEGWKDHFNTLHDMEVYAMHWNADKDLGFCQHHDLSPEIKACNCINLQLVLMLISK